MKRLAIITASLLTVLSGWNMSAQTSKYGHGEDSLNSVLEGDVRVRDTTRDRYETREYEEQGCTDTGRNDFLNRIIFHIYFSPLIPKLNKSPSSTGFL